MILRKMTTEDVEAVAAIEQSIFSIPWTKQGFLDALNLSNTCYLVAVEKDEICGYCGLYQSFDEADIVNVAVAKSHRRKGIGRKLMEELLFQGRQMGTNRFLLEVRVSNRPAINLYASVGFSIDGIRKGFYEKPKEDAYLLSLEVKGSISH